MTSQSQSSDWMVADRGEAWGILEEPSSCPSCGRDFDVPLLLPCSHTLCGGCVEAVARSSGGPEQPTIGPRICALPCPRCRLSVELPCWEWDSATRCLPLNPAVTRRLGTKEPKGDQGHPEEEAATGMQEDTKASLEAEPCLGNECDSAGEVTVCECADWPLGGAVDLQEEEMEQSVSGLVFSLDPSTAAPPLFLSGSALTVTFKGQGAPPQAPRVAVPPLGPEHVESWPLPQVSATVVITRGQYYWEADVCNSTCYRIGVSSVENARAWWLERKGSSFSVVFDGRREPLPVVPPQMKTVGVFLNMGGGALSFHNALTQEHLATLPSRFGPGVRPALCLGQGRLRLRCGLPPPPHVFLCRSSAYRCPAGAGVGRWRRDVRFHSVRSFIQKFEELSIAESDSGLVSSFGSCSTLASLPDSGP
ncbi:hypothetical protein AGOR_G00128020 [Albula goreensis]|uniref:Uncharacterized protein n=1 Tax=Albula goreensis TaxID=1534307 RepID=A0A8T3DAT2_9TELE|nr:hypothetical protein AGOR_G00128020 [Albula goreensis]